MNTKARPNIDKRYNFISAIVAFCLWGGWAYYINHTPNTYTGFISGITQGLASFIITLFMVYVLNWFFHSIKNKKLRLILPAVITVSFTGSCLVVVHSLMHTPEILYTIAPALSVAFIFCLFTTYKLQKNELIRGDLK